MPFILGILGILAAAYFWSLRARDAANMAGDLVDMASDVKAAARRFGFTRKTNIHPVESIEDPNIAAAGIAEAFLALDDMPTRDQQSAMRVQLRRVLQVDDATAEELMVLGHWMVNECGGAQPALARLSRKLYRLEGPSALTPLMDIITGSLPADHADLSIRQTEAIAELKTAFRLR